MKGDPVCCPVCGSEDVHRADFYRQVPGEAAGVFQYFWWCDPCGKPLVGQRRYLRVSQLKPIEHYDRLEVASFGGFSP